MAGRLPTGLRRETDHYPYMLIYESGKMPSSPSTQFSGISPSIRSLTGLSGDIRSLNIDFQQSNGDWGVGQRTPAIREASPATSIGRAARGLGPRRRLRSRSPGDPAAARNRAIGQPMAVSSIRLPPISMAQTVFNTRPTTALSTCSPATVHDQRRSVHQTPSGHDALITLAPMPPTLSRRPTSVSAMPKTSRPTRSPAWWSPPCQRLASFELAGQPVTAGQFVAVSRLDGGKPDLCLRPARRGPPGPSSLSGRGQRQHSQRRGESWIPRPKRSLSIRPPCQQHVLCDRLEHGARQVAGRYAPGVDWLLDRAGLTYEADGSQGVFFGLPETAIREHRATAWATRMVPYVRRSQRRNLVPGTYSIPQQYQYSANEPYLAVYGGGHYFGNYAYGQFTVNQVVFGPSGTLQQLDATFVEFPGCPAWPRSKDACSIIRRQQMP